MQGTGGIGTFGAGQVVENDDIAVAQRRLQLGGDIEIERMRRFRPIDLTGSGPVIGLG
jgi:hypothetical protein